MRNHRRQHPAPKSWALTSLIAGIFITLAVTLATYFWPQSAAVKDALLIALIGISVSVAMSGRLKLSEMSQSIDQLERDSQGLNRIQQWAKRDHVVLDRYNELRKELDELSAGKYRIRTIDEVFEDDVRSINELHKGEILRSTCPISMVSAQEARAQIADLRYLASVKAHIAAAQRGVEVTRVYLFRDLDAFGDDEIIQHLKMLDTKLRVRIVLHSTARLRDGFDYLVFGTRRVSIGDIGGTTGTVQAATIESNRDVVERYIEKYTQLLALADSLDETIAKLDKHRAGKGP
nr:hypothetical protein [Kibdelosporangium sp. MJ126-NF4]CEL22094.1 hypothetical protein [Kibdelosporangium sp. MJ126-NF4]CTQ92875.1 hypothetical protein [Kibdelosporangium sp. MJ126-NF4]